MTRSARTARNRSPAAGQRLAKTAPICCDDAAAEHGRGSADTRSIPAVPSSRN